MTVAELIAELRKMPQDATVRYYEQENCCFDFVIGVADKNEEWDRMDNIPDGCVAIMTSIFP